MLYLFSSNSDYLLKQNVAEWKNRFIEKYGDFNCIDIKTISENDKNLLTEHVTGSSFLNEKKLVLISLEGKYSEDFKDFLLNIFTKISDENIVVCYILNPDKRTKFIKNIIKLGTHKEFIMSEENTQQQLKQKFGNRISLSALNEIIRYKGGDIGKIISEIDKLFITKDTIEISDIHSHIFPEFEESLFILIDHILQKNIDQSIGTLRNIAEQNSIYQLYVSILSNLRNTLYIQLLKNKNIPAHQITKILSLGNKSFLVNKSYKASFEQIKNIYTDLVNIDGRNKTGKLLDGKDSDFLYLIEKTIIKNLS